VTGYGSSRAPAAPDAWAASAPGLSSAADQRPGRHPERSRIRWWSAALTVLCLGTLWLEFRHIERTMPYRRLAESLTEASRGRRVLETFGTNDVLVNYSYSTPWGDPAFDIAVLR
jgi:hypothetical protein